MRAVPVFDDQRCGLRKDIRRMFALINNALRQSRPR